MHKKIQNFERLALEALIFYPSFVENSIQFKEHWLLSKELSKKLSEEMELKFSGITEKIYDFGCLKFHLNLMSSENTKSETITKRGMIFNWLDHAA